MNELLGGDAEARRSLLLKYTSLPPQLVFLRAIRGRHFLLAALALTALLANVLTVALSGLFTQQSVFGSLDWPLKSTYRPKFQFVLDGRPSPAYASFIQTWDPNDAIYAVLDNLTNETGLPPWTTPDYFFLPLEFDTNLPGQWRTQTCGPVDWVRGRL